MADVTTMKISTATRDRLRSLAGDGQTLEEVVVDALDLYERDRFWAEAERVVATDSSGAKAARAAIEADIDNWMDR